MVLIDAGRRHVEVNGAYLSLVGYPRNVLIGRPVYEIVENGPKLSEAEWQAALESREALGHIRVVCADGRTIAVDYAAHPEMVSGRRLVLFVALHVERRQRRHRPKGLAAPHELTARELEIVELVARGESGPEIATELHISYATVRTHVRNAQEKLGAQSRAQLVAIALGEGHFAER
jgi:PAS domain S-box-containing protein